MISRRAYLPDLFRLSIFCLIVAVAVPAAYAQRGGSGQRDFDQLSQMDFSKLRVDDLTDEQVQAFWEKAQERGLTMRDLEQMALSRGMPYSEVYKLRVRIREVQLRQRTEEREREREKVDARSKGKQPTRNARGEEDEEYDPNDPFNMLVESRRTYLPEDDSTEIDSTFFDFEPDTTTRKPIFGENLFKTEELTFAPTLNLPTPENYQLGPGDELVIDIWGAAQMTYTEEVSREGTVVLENLGPIYVNGLTMKEAKDRILSRLSQLYGGLDVREPTNGNTYADISLGKVRSIRISIVGEVNRPGSYTLPSLSTVINALYVCGGPNENGTYRRIQVIRGGGVFSEFDVYDFLVYGEQRGNIRLLDQDIIKVDPYLARVETEGELKREMFFETKEGETVADLLRFAGSFTGEAYTKLIRIHRSTATEKRLVDVTNTDFPSVELRNGDKVFVDKILERFENRVEIKGAVYREGEYELGNAQTVYALIQRAEGLQGDALLSRAQIYRTREDMTLEMIPFDLGKVMQDPASNDILLRKDDVVVIPSTYDLTEEYFVEIGGSVQDPGKYPYMADMTLEDLVVMAQGLKEEASILRVEVSRRRTGSGGQAEESGIAEIHQFTIDSKLGLNGDGSLFVLQPFDKVFVFKSPNYIEQREVRITGEVLYPGAYTIATKDDRISDIVRRAGGLTPEAYPRGAILIRSEPDSGAVGINLDQILSAPSTRYDLLVLAGDSIHVPPRLETVQVSGAVFQPTLVRYSDGLSLRDYISRAGGPTDVADLERTYVVYPNGTVDRMRDRLLFFDYYPRLEPGAEIVVPIRLEDRKLSAQERALIFSSIASVAAVLSTAIVQIIQLTR